MKKIPLGIISADIHLREDTPVSRIDDYWQAQANKIHWLSELQKKLYCPILDGGDLFNKWKSSPRLLAWAINNLPADFNTVIGNHDMPNHSLELFDKSSMAVMEASEVVNCRVFDFVDGNVPDGTWIYRLHYGEESIDDLCKFLFKNKKHKGKKVLLAHMMCYQTVSYPGADRKGNYKHIVRRFGKDFDLIVTGDNHESFSYEYEKGKWLVNPGSMMRTSIAQKKHKPRVYIWYSDGTLEAKYYPIEKDVFIDKEDAVERDNRIEAFVTMLKDNIEMTLSFEENIKIYLEKNKIDVGIKSIIKEVVYD